MIKSILGICVALFSALTASAQVNREIYFADVTIYVEGGKYYLTGSKGDSDGTLGFALLESRDLKTWSVPEKSIDPKGMILTKGDHVFGTKGFWAPQIFKDKGTYYITYTADEQTVMAQSKSLLGPYRQEEVGPIDSSEKNIDSYIFKDTDGKCYLYHVRFDQGNYLHVAEFDLQTGKINPQTLKRCFGQTAPWEATSNFKSAPIMEGPTVIKLKNRYYMFYSANHFQNIDYAVGYAVADSPYGPWIKHKNNPIIHRSIVGENGSGHGDLFEGKNQQLFYVYHIHNSPDKVGPRRTRIVPVVKKWDETAGVYVFSVKAEDMIVPVKIEK